MAVFGRAFSKFSLEQEGIARRHHLSGRQAREDLGAPAAPSAGSHLHGVEPFLAAYEHNILALDVLYGLVWQHENSRPSSAPLGPDDDFGKTPRLQVLSARGNREHDRSAATFGAS